MGTVSPNHWRKPLHAGQIDACLLMHPCPWAHQWQATRPSRRCSGADGSNQHVGFKPVLRVSEKITNILVQIALRMWKAGATSDHLAGRPHGLRKTEGQVAAAAAHVQSCVPLGCIAPLDCHALPYAMLPQAQHIVQLPQHH